MDAPFLEQARESCFDDQNPQLPEAPVSELNNRSLIPIRLVTALPQVSPCGETRHRSTPARWALYGIGGVRLESMEDRWAALYHGGGP
jgi:hypothetical protein